MRRLLSDMALEFAGTVLGLAITGGLIVAIAFAFDGPTVWFVGFAASNLILLAMTWVAEGRLQNLPVLVLHLLWVAFASMALKDVWGSAWATGLGLVWVLCMFVGPVALDSYRRRESSE